MLLSLSYFKYSNDHLFNCLLDPEYIQNIIYFQVLSITLTITISFYVLHLNLTLERCRKIKIPQCSTPSTNFPLLFSGFWVDFRPLQPGSALARRIRGLQAALHSTFTFWTFLLSLPFSFSSRLPWGQETTPNGFTSSPAGSPHRLFLLSLPPWLAAWVGPFQLSRGLSTCLCGRCSHISSLETLSVTVNSELTHCTGIHLPPKVFTDHSTNNFLSHRLLYILLPALLLPPWHLALCESKWKLGRFSPIYCSVLSA